MERLLSQAAAELALRSEVEATLSSLCHDVEHAHSLETSLRAHTELQSCKEELAALRVRYEEREAAWEADRREKERLGRVLLGEVVALSAREVEGERGKEEVEMKLRALEEEKRRAGGVFVVQQQSVAAVHADKGDGKVEEQKPGGDASEPNAAEEIAQSDAEEASNNVSTDLGEKPTISETTKAIEGGAAEGNDDAPSASAVTASTEPIAPAFIPHELDEKTLMNVFAYSDPIDVMNFAQTNKALLAKVNEMFGMSGGEESDVEQPQPTGPSEIAAASVEKAESLPAKPPTAAVASATDATNSVPSSPAKSSPKLFGMAGPSHKRQGSSTSIATAGSAGSANPFSLPSWFGSGDASGTPASAAANPAASADAGSEIKLNAAMASSMASKLTPAELSIILRMREKLQKCEADANKWKLEKEDAMANLASVESVKEFLVTRVRDTERVVQKQKEDMREKDNKNLEDQEVIVFLDERVKELESAVEATKSKEAATRQEVQSVVEKHEKKARVLSDMLQFEREQMTASKDEWKAAKKVLVKEVKSCRARIVALEAEVDGCRQQNAQLKQGLAALSQPSNSMSPRAKKNMKGSGRL
ncbi:hypothetical protein ACHAXT_008070 [Thalassiosira profunda]